MKLFGAGFGGKGAFMRIMRIMPPRIPGLDEGEQMRKERTERTHSAAPRRFCCAAVVRWRPKTQF
jgi:hypothetical protein